MRNGNLALEEAQAPTGRSRGRPSLEQAAAIDADLIDAAFREFCRNGYGGTSMRSVAREANVSRTTLAARYATKAELFQAILRWQTENVGAFVTLEGQASSNLREALIAAAEACLEGCQTGPTTDLCRLVAASSARFPEVATSLTDIEVMVVDQISQVIERCAVAEGVPCRDPQVPAKAFFLLLRGWSFGYMLQGTEAWADNSWVEPVVDLLLAGRASW
jgi:AcrR family transcriptional regulator